MYRMKKSLLLFLFVIVSFNGFSQQYVTTGDFDRLSKVTFGIGFNTYFGDLRKAQDPLQLGLSASIGYEHMFTDNIAIRTGFAVYKIQADDSLNRIPANKNRNLNFKATNAEFTVSAVYYTQRHPASGYKDRAFANPYFHLGLGVTTNNPKTDLNGTEYDLRPLTIEGVQYGGLAVVVPLGVGINWYISRNVDLQMNVQYNLALTGYLDDVNGVYRDPSSFSDTNGVSAAELGLLSDPRAALTPPLDPLAAGTARGDGTNDSYLRVGFKLGFYLPKSLYGKSSIRCKVVKKTR